MDDNKMVFQLKWAKMPLSKEELDRIDEFHRIRPYLLFMENKNYYYSFPCTSKYFEKEIRYENSVVRLDRIIDYRKSLILLDTVYKMPKKNIMQHAAYVPLSVEHELIKKIHINKDYYDYPEEVVNYFSKFEDIYENKDIVSINNDLYVIDNISDDNCLCIPLYRYPVKGTYQIEIDSLYFYVDVNSRVSFNKNNIDSYVSKTLLNFIYPKDFDYLFEKVEDQIDYSKLYNLTPGMILKYKSGEDLYRMIVLTNKDNELEALIGRDNQTYGNYTYERISTDLDFEYEIFGTLNSKRLENLKLKHEDELKHEHVLKLKK